MEAIEKVEEELGIVLPSDYIAFIETSNGGEGWVGNPYLRLWPVEEIQLMNESLHAAEYAPGVVFFGGDGGGMLYGIDNRLDPPAFIEVDSVSIGIDEDTKVHRTTFTGFLQTLHQRLFGFCVSNVLAH
jgi:SMI1/KNR4 family protein SUKH-1